MFLGGAVFGSVLTGVVIFLLSSGIVETAVGISVPLALGGLVLFLVCIAITLCVAGVGWLIGAPARLRRLWVWMAMKTYTHKPSPPHQHN